MGSGGRYLLGGKGCSLADPAGAMLYLHKEQNKYRTENDSTLHIMMAESSGQIFNLILPALVGISLGHIEYHVATASRE